MSQSNATEHNRKKRGQATVELALALMFLVLLLVGVADVARIYSEHLAVVDAAGVAARWSSLEPTNKGCTYPAPYANEAAVVAAALGPTVVAQLQPTVQVIQQAAPNSVRVNVTYRHTFLFGLIDYVDNTFTGGSTMPGVISTPAACYSTPGVTVTPAPTFTPGPTSTIIPPPPTDTPSLGTPTPTATACGTHGLIGVSASACDFGSTGWQASITVQGFVPGDSVTFQRFKNGGGAAVETGTVNVCPGGVCTYTSNQNINGNTPQVKFTLNPAVGSCPVGVTEVGPIDIPACAPATSTPTSIPTFTPTNTPTYTPTFTPTATLTNTPNVPASQTALAATQTAGTAATQTAVVGATQTAGAGATQTAIAGATQTAGTAATQTAGVQATQTAVAGATQTSIVQATQTATADFVLSANPASFTINRGDVVTSTITVTSLGGYVGAINLSAVFTPANSKFHVSVSPVSVTIAPSSPGTANLRIEADNASGSSGSYTITVSGSDGTITKTTTVNVTVR